MVMNVALLCSLDSKGPESEYLKQQIEARGANAILMDIGIGGEPQIIPDISAYEIARAGGGDIREIRASRDTGKVTPIMIEGAKIKVLELLGQGKLDGIIAFGGSSNATTASTIMKSLPFGVPKFMVTSAASMPASAPNFIGTKDMVMMNSVVDISDLNDLTKSVLERAAGGICGMAAASHGAVLPVSDTSLIAVTTFKFSELCSQNVMKLLTERGYSVIPFHAQGMGDRAMEELIDQGLFDGIIDIVPAGLGEELLGGNRRAGPHRLEAAGHMGIPQVITPCGFDMLSCGPISRRDSNDPLWTERHLAERKSFIPDEYRVQVRTTAEELNDIAIAMASELNKSSGPVKILIPTNGWSSLSVKGAELHDPDSDAVFVPALQKHLRTDIEVRELDTDFGAMEFSIALVDALEAMMGAPMQ